MNSCSQKIGRLKSAIELIKDDIQKGILTKFRKTIYRPFTKAVTDYNLVEENEGVNIILKQSSKSIKKDKFSAFEYGLYYIKQEEDRKKKRKKRDIASMMFYGGSK